MTSAKLISARLTAVKVLNKFNPTRHNATDILHHVLETTDRKAQATDLVFGAIRNRPAIDMVISKTAQLPIKRIQKKLLNILRVGVYELIYAPQTAEYAIVNEAVENASSFTGKKQSGFVNAVLRNVLRSIEKRTTDMKTCEQTRILPQSPKYGCLFKDKILPDPQENPTGHLSVAFSLPEWLVKLWLKQFDYPQTRLICFASNRRPEVFIWPNILKISADKLADRFTNSGVEFEMLSGHSAFINKGHKLVTELQGFSEGLFTVQDPTSAHCVKILSPKPGQTIIDLCAAPGGKTINMAQMMQNKGKIIATDIDSERLRKVDQNCRRLGITTVQTVRYNRFEQMISSVGHCDSVLLDVPCSNTGVLARRCEVRLRLTPTIVMELTKKQYQLLNQASKILAGRGKICYSTCSIIEEENIDVVRRFVRENPDFKLLSEKLILPRTAHESDFACDGGYVALLER